jgi:sterol desaturase/sphingolipid hydroxylase (fatty acid hydroxylase superfamily)
MNIFTLEHGKTAFRADIALYCITIAVMAGYLMAGAPRALRPEMVILAVAGLVSWSAIEYAMHRFLLHGLQPFMSWHERHHQRPKAIIFTPTILSLTWQFILIFIPVLLAFGILRACALTLGMLTGYLAYTITHHAVHHSHSGNPWLKRRKRWHAIHHYRNEQPGCYGVTTEFWDHVFGSTLLAAEPENVDRKPGVN